MPFGRGCSLWPGRYEDGVVMTAAKDSKDNRLPRLLVLVPYFLAHPGIALVEAAADLGVSPQQLEKDITLLSMCGMPGYGPGELIDVDFDQLDGGYVTITFDANLDRPVRFNAKEALSLVVALQTLADMPGLTDGDVVMRTLAKIEAVYGAPVDDSTVAVQIEHGERFVPMLHRATEEGRALRLSYYTSARDDTSERVVDPLRIVTDDGRTYLQAWCRQAEGIRVFRADRINDATLLDEPARPPRISRFPNWSTESFVLPLTTYWSC